MKLAIDLVGEIRRFGTLQPPTGWMTCDGAELRIAEHQPLFALLGWTCGGDGHSTFRLPALWERPSGCIYAIAVNGFYPTRDEAMPDAGTVGEIRLFAGRHAPVGWVPCDGRLLPIEAPYLELYSILGKRWGGDVATFGVPNFWDEPQTGTASVVDRYSYLVACVQPSSPAVADPNS
ncbi:MAG TPA: tail fiber protein [Gemmatimonadaceae bacterium]|jgi:microcystin-dependent protein